MLKAILSFFFPRGNLITPCYKSELNFNSKEIATGSISHRKKNYYTWFETEEFIVFLSPIYKLRDRSVVGHYRMSDANSGWKRKVCKSFGFSIYTPAYKPIFWIFARYGVSHQPRKNAVSVNITSRTSFVSFSCAYLYSGLIIPHPRAFELFKNGSFLFPTI